MKHIHAEVIIAKALNLDLINFVKDGNSWKETDSDYFAKSKDYFLCHSRHKALCKKALNGSVPVSVNGDNVNLSESIKDSCVIGAFRDGNASIKFSPIRVKRWIGVNPVGFCSNHYKSLEIAKLNHPDLSQFIEIEVKFD